MQQKKIYIAYTGGTIGMQKTAQGYQPAPGLLQAFMAKMPEFQHPEMPHYTIKEYQPLIDSANMTPSYWNRIATDIYKNYHAYDGFVILHGTDTMAYTASALSFMFTGLQKPVILTGSQIPLVELRNDVRGNLINSVLLAANYPLTEVCIFFDHKLLRGNRSTKLNSLSFNAFASPRYPALVNIGINIDVQQHLLWQSTDEPIALQTIEPQVISMLPLFPGMPLELLATTLKTPRLNALILLSYGMGNAPHDAAFLHLIQQAIANNVIVVNATQCLYGDTNMENYATGQKLAEVGVISAADMTHEATLTKLFYLLTQEKSKLIVKRNMNKNLRGELSSSAI